jgi:hypothetical protein
MPVAVNEPGRGWHPSQVVTVETPAFQAGDFSLRTAPKGGFQTGVSFTMNWISAIKEITTFLRKEARAIVSTRAKLIWIGMSAAGRIAPWANTASDRIAGESAVRRESDISVDFGRASLSCPCPL